jgi:Spy/CpxP family protein refolding chaperone
MKNILLSLIVLATLMSCASKEKRVEREIERKADTSVVTDSKSLGGTIENAIENSKHLTPEQKNKLRNIVANNKSLAESLSQQSYKYRGLLVQELFSDKVNDKKIEIIENDIRKVEQLRLKNTFETVKKMSTILSGHPDKDEFQEHLKAFGEERLGTQR